jgi:hypothetical protein
MLDKRPKTEEIDQQALPKSSARDMDILFVHRVTQAADCQVGGGSGLLTSQSHDGTRRLCCRHARLHAMCGDH